jgi:hypothetical protein
MGEVITLDAVTRGWVMSNGQSAGGDPHSNYLVGHLNHVLLGGEYRNWFSFDLSEINQQIVSAQLVLDNVLVDLDQDSATVTYDISSYDGSMNFSSMGTGLLFGQRQYDALDSGGVSVINLNSDALEQLNATQFFQVSGRVSDGALFDQDQPNQFIMGGTHTGAVSRLRITIIPTPGSILVLCSFAVVSQRRR